MIKRIEIRLIGVEGEEVFYTHDNVQERDDFTWTLLPFCNAISGMGFNLPPDRLVLEAADPAFGDDQTAIDLYCDSPASLVVDKWGQE